MEIEDRVRSEVIDNPALEVVENDEMPSEDASQRDEISDFLQDGDDLRDAEFGCDRSAFQSVAGGGGAVAYTSEQVPDTPGRERGILDRV